MTSPGFKNRIFYGWIVVIVFLLIQAVMMGIGSSFTIFFKSIEAEFLLSRTTTSSIASVSMILIPVSGFIGGWALDKYGPRIVLFIMGVFTGLSMVLTSQTSAAWQLFITYGVLLAVGMGAIYVVATSTVSRWFDKKRALAVGITGSGEGVGTVAMAPFATFLIAKFDWKPAYRIIGFIAWAIVLPLSQFLKKEPGEIGALPDGVRENSANNRAGETGVDGNNETVASLSLAEAVRTRGFWLVVGVWLFFSFCMSMLFTHIAPHLTDIGISETDAAVVISVMGIARVIGMIGLGVVADRIGRKKVAVISTLIQAGAMLWLVWAGELWMFFLFAVLYGLGNGGLFTGVTALLGDTFGLKRLGSILGLLEIGWGTGAAAGPLVGGFIFDSTQSYSWAFILCAAAMTVIAVLVVMLKPETDRNIATLS